jgi:hypothetical protein
MGLPLVLLETCGIGPILFSAMNRVGHVQHGARPRPSAIKVRRSRGSPRSVGRVSKANRVNKGQQGQAPQGQAQQGQSGGKVALTTAQRTKIRETVLVGGNAPRATNVNFSVTVGTTVPTSVRVVAVPQVLVEIYPEYRRHMHFVVATR